MKKIININLNGRVIPIEDSAYEKLQGYIESLRRYFANEEGRDEIINDIESRIAELLHDKVRKGTDAITEEDIEAVIVSMGRVEDFEAQDKETAEAPPLESQSNYSYTGKKTKGRLYRDTKDRFIGGVCSGIAAYLNVDPAVVRLLFAVIGFGTGVGFIAYIILWIVLPPKDLEGFAGKRMYRNPDDRVIGGVAGGLAAYFDKKASWIRLIFAAPIILNILINIVSGFSWDNDIDLAMNIGFGSITGTFILTYIILWIVLPEANSDYEKMEMRGETVDVHRIRQNVREGMGSVKERMKGWSEEVKESAQNLSNKAKDFAGTRGKAFANEFRETARRTGGGLGHAIGVIFKVFFLFIAGSIAFSLFVSLIALLFGGIAWWPVNNFLWTSKWQQVFAWGTLIFFLIVPLVAFITWVTRRIIRAKSKNNYLGWTFGGLWAIGWVAGTLLAASLAKDFREYEHNDSPIQINQPANGKIIVAVSQPALEYTGRFDWIDDGGEGWDLSSDTLKLSNVRFDIKASTDSLYHVTVKRYSFGKTEDDAMDRAARIQYMAISRDSVLDLGPGFSIDKKSKFRGQQVEIEILIPIGKKIRFDESVNDKLNSVNVRVKKTSRRRRIVNIDVNNDHSFRYRPGVDYIMGVNGELKDANLSGTVPPANEYRYKNEQDSLDIDRSIQEKEKELQELRDKKKGTQTKPQVIIRKESIQKSRESVTSGPNPGHGLVEWF